jgi:hypothetical protein
MKIQPGTALKDVQLSLGISLIAQEVAEFNPRRVLVLAGRNWFSPFGKGLGLDIQWQTGPGEGISTSANRQWVIAKHPMAKRESTFVEEILQAFAGQNHLELK